MRWFMLVVCIGFLLGLAPAHAQDDPPPYLFYYSMQHNAFVIERADGTDSRLLADGVMSPETNAADGPGWSPSGEWFAWSSREIIATGANSPSQPHAISVDGTRRVTTLDAYPHAVVDWVPGTDLLLVVGYSYSPAMDEETGKYTLFLDTAIIDPVADVVLATHRWAVRTTRDKVTAPYLGFKWGWSSDGQYVIIRDQRIGWTDYTGPRTSTFYMLGLDGAAITREFKTDIFDWPGQDAAHITYVDDNALVVENLITGEQEQFEDPPAPIYQIEWRHDGRYALIILQERQSSQQENTGTDLLLLDRATGQFSLISAQFQNEDPTHIPESYWSPSGNYAIFFAGDRRFYVFDLARQSVHSLTPPLEDPQYRLLIYWSGWHWYDDDQVLVAGEPTGDGLQQIHLCNLPAIRCDTQHIPNYHFDSFPQVSANQRYAAYITDEVMIADLVNQTVQLLPPDSRSYFSIPAGEIFWHPSADWFIIRDNALYAGGAYIRWNSVASASGSLKRELSFCWASPICIDWLPPQVDPARLAPGTDPVPQPALVTVLHGDHWAWYLSWSPDSTHLLAGRDPHESHDPERGGPGKSTLWNVTSGERVSTFPLIDWNEDVQWLTTSGPDYILRFVTLDNVYGLNYLAISPDGSQKVITDAVIDNETGAALHVFEGHLAPGWYPPVTVDYNADGSWLATPLQAGSNSRLVIWDTTTWEEITAIPGTFQAVAFSPDGQWLAASSSWNISIWAVADLIAGE